MTINLDIKKKLFYDMLRIRLVEETIATRYAEQKMRTPTHLSIGQEGVAAVAGQILKSQDYVVSTHRSHAHYLAKGGDLKAMIAELYGKVTGCSRGRGGSMHLVDTRVGFMGSAAIVGNTIPIGVGLGLAIQLSQEDRISCIFLGDGAIEEGVFYEALNFAVLKKTPVLFLCENNFYSVYSPLKKRQPENRKIYNIAKAMGALIDFGDGNDVLSCYKKTKEAVESIRQGSGPVFLEFETYRWREHCGPNYDNDIGYRSIEEFEIWKARDPIINLKQHLKKAHDITENDCSVMSDKIIREIEEAYVFAENSPFPLPAEATTGQYKEAILHQEKNELYYCD